MKNRARKYLSVLLCAVLALVPLTPVFAAAANPFFDGAYASVLTGSDFQALGTEAYDRFGRMLTLMRNAGMATPDSMLVGGDYTKILFDYAVPGISQIRQQLVDVYPDADPDSVICIQGNHDNPSSGFTKTGFYDMGVYCLYVINEDDFPWLQGLRPGIASHIKSVAADLEQNLNAMIAAEDLRPVIVLTHLPLHHTSRVLYSDNMYASYLFNVLNKAGNTLDVIFLFGHQHSGDYDDYIGGSVNFMEPGDTIRIPRPDKAGENCYTEETLTFTYTNCGYVGYSDNTQSDTSTNVLTLGVIRFCDDAFRFIKYTEEGLYSVEESARRNPVRGTSRNGTPTVLSRSLWVLENRVFGWFFDLFIKLRGLFAF